MNKVNLLGRITKDLELRYTQSSNKANLKFQVAVNRSKEETAWINCEAWEKCAENINKYFSKGKQIGITGHITTGSYDDKDGKKVYTWAVVVDEFDFIDGKKENDAPFEQQTQDFNEVTDDDLPF